MIHRLKIDCLSMTPSSYQVGGATSSLTIDLAFLLEGREEDELPETVLGTVRLNHMQLTSAAKASSFHDAAAGSESA